MIRSKTKLLLVAVLMIVFMVASATMASAAVTETAGTDYTGTTQAEAEQALKDAMAAVETSGKDYVLTLKSNMFFGIEGKNPSGTPVTWITAGTGTSKGTLIIESELDSTGAPKYGITIDPARVIHFRGNVTFRNIILERDSADGRSYYNGSYFFVTEGKGTFAENITNPNTSNTATPSIAGSDIEVYSGEYVAIGANFYSGKSVDKPEIIVGGTTVAEIVAGRGMYGHSSSTVTGESVITVKESARITSYLTAGLFKPTLNNSTAMGGNATLNLEGGSVNILAYAGVSANGGTQGASYNLGSNNTKSKYTINLTGGRLMGVSCVYYMDAVPANNIGVKYLDIDLNIGGMTIDNEKYIYGGVYLPVDTSGFKFDESNVNINIDGATFPSKSGFFAGSFFSGKNEDSAHPNVDNATRTVSIKKSTFASDYIIFGSRFDKTVSGVAQISYCDHSGDTTVTVTAATEGTVGDDKVNFGSGEMYGGSYLKAQYAKHSGDTTITMSGAKLGTVESLPLGGRTRYSGSSLRASNTSHTGNTTATYNGGGVNVYYSGVTKPIFALHKVEAGLTGVSIAGNATTTFGTNIHVGGLVFGGSVLESPVTNTGKTQLVLINATTYGSVTQGPFYGGDLIKHTGENNDSTATCELYIKTWSVISNVNVNFFGGSRFEAAGKSSINSTVKFSNYTLGTKLISDIYGGSEFRAAGEHKGTSNLIVPEGGWGSSISGSVELFGGSRMLAAGAKQSGNSLITYTKDAFFPATKTATLLDEGGMFGGSNLETAGTEHSGNSLVSMGVSNKTSYVRTDTFGGSKITAASVHSGSSEIRVTSAPVQDVCNVFGGSYLMANKAIHSGDSKINYVNKTGASNVPSKVCAGSYIGVDGAVNSGTSTFEVNNGEISSFHSAGSYAAVSITDNNTNDIIPGGFCHTGDVRFVINGGSYTASASHSHIAGYNANVDGDVYVIINGGTISSQLFTITGTYSNNVAVSGDSILKIYGGTFTAQKIVNGSANNDTTKAVGVNAVLGTYYTEIADDGKGEDIVFAYKPSGVVTKIDLEPAGRGLKADYASSTAYVRFVGDVELANADGTKLIDFYFTSRLAYMTNRYIDYSQYTKSSDTSKMPDVSSFNKIFRHVKGNRFIIKNYDAATAKLGDLSSAAGMTFDWWSDYAYADLVAFDSYTEFKNAPIFVDGTTHQPLTNGIGINTSSVKLKVGSVYSNAFAITSAVIAAAKQAAVEKINTNNGVKGFSIRVKDIGFRYRAKINQNFFDQYKANISAADGFKIKELGINVSATVNGSPYNTKAPVWKDGSLASNVSGGKWYTDDNDGYNYYAAVITGYDNAKDRLMTQFTFNIYFIYEDINGVTNTVNFDATAPTSLYEIADRIAESKEDDVVAWYQRNEDAVNAIIKTCETVA